MPLAGDKIRASDVIKLVDHAENATNVTLSTTAGVYSDIIVGAAFSPTSGHRYKATYAGGDNLLIGGSGFATSDTWLMKIQVSVAGGAYADVLGAWYIARAPVAQTFRYPIPVGVVTYLAASGSTLRFKAIATKSVGAGTVTSTLETGSGSASVFQIIVEDMGEDV